MAKPKDIDASDDAAPIITDAADSGLLADDAMDEILIGLDSVSQTSEGFTLAKDLRVADLVVDDDQAPEIDLTRILGPEPAGESGAEAPAGEAEAVDFTVGFGPTAVSILVDDDSSDGGVSI